MPPGSKTVRDEVASTRPPASRAMIEARNGERPAAVLLGLGVGTEDDIEPQVAS